MWISPARCPAPPLIRPALPGTFSRKREKDAPAASRYSLPYPLYSAIYRPALKSVA